MLDRAHQGLVFAVFASRFVNAVSVEQNYTICNWARLRAGIVRDSLYLDGGLLWWQTAFADGTAPVVSSDGNAAGDMYRLEFSTPFDTSSTNLSALFQSMPKAGGAGNNIAPNYVDGTMFTNDDELGLPRLTDSASAQSADTILGYEAFQYGAQRDGWSPGFYQGNLPGGVTRFITNGAGVSVPSENLGFYFSGMRSLDWGPIYYEDSSANTTANTLIEVDLSTMRGETWTNTTLPDDVTPRANAELVWIPVSENGVLIAIGGVTSPEEIWATGLNKSQTSESQAESPTFMTSLSVYDISSKTWYLQNTTGDSPPQLTEFCSVVATANDSSSFNVYIYGGYDGLNAKDEPSDDVWILSVPSFTWVKGYSGHASHGRSGHRCMMPYPDKMLVVGGIHQNQAECVEGGIIQVFNLNTLQFENTYRPDDWSEFKVPDVVTTVIGGNARGGSTNRASWSDPALGGVFGTKYHRQITHYYPYATNNTITTTAGSDNGSGSNHTRTIAIAVGIAAGIVALILLLVLLLICRRRRILRSSNGSDTTSTKNSRISRWINGTPTTQPPSRPIPKGSPSSSLETQQINSYSAISTRHTTPNQETKHHEMSAAVERPLPPFEMATPYNNESEPRHHPGVVDYAYHPSHGHGHAYNHSGSTSSNYSGHQYSPAESTTHLHVPHASSTPSSGSTAAWPFSNPSPSISTPSPLPEVPPIPPQYRNQNQHLTLHQQERQIDSSVSSEPDSPLSPEASMPQGMADEYRRSLMSPVSPQAAGNSWWRGSAVSAMSGGNRDSGAGSGWRDSGGSSAGPEIRNGKEIWWHRS